jgi:hypothetical protein
MFWPTKWICKVSKWFRAFSGHYWAPVWLVEATDLTGQCAGPIQILGTGLIDVVDRPEQGYCSCSILPSGLHAFVQGELHWFRSSLHVCRGSSLWFVLFIWACFCLGRVEPLSLPNGTETFFSSDLALCLFLAFKRLLKFLLVVSFFPFLFGYQNVCVVNALIKWGLRTFVVRGLVDGHFLVWWVTDNVV